MARSFTPDASQPFLYGVVIPAFNSETTIEAAIRSVLRQRLLPNEIIVVDDGSTDRTPSIVMSISSPLIRLIRQSNAGPGSARNRGIDAAKSEWIAFLDADDLWAGDHAWNLRALNATFPQAGLLAATHREVREVPEIDLAQTQTDPDRLIDFFEASGLTPFHTSAVAIRRELVREIGAFPTRFPGEDVDLWLRSALVAPIAMTSRTTTYYVRRPDSVMSCSTHNTRDLLKQPLLQSIEEALTDKRYTAARSSLLGYREKAYRLFLRQAIARSEALNAREILFAMRSKRISAPLHLRLLSSMSPRLLRFGHRLRRAITSTSSQ